MNKKEELVDAIVALGIDDRPLLVGFPTIRGKFKQSGRFLNDGNALYCSIGTSRYTLFLSTYPMSDRVETLRYSQGFIRQIITKVPKAILRAAVNTQNRYIGQDKIELVEGEG